MHRIRWVALIAAALCLTPIAKPRPTPTSLRGVQKGNYAVFERLEAAAQGGSASCQIFLGVPLSEGKGVKADPAAAARWFRLAAEQGNPVGAVQSRLRL